MVAAEPRVMGSKAQPRRPSSSNTVRRLGRVGRYELFQELARGGMATVHFGRLCGAQGFVKVVAIKRLHPQYARDDEFVRSFKHEAGLAARIRHPNVTSTLDVVSQDGELFVVMEYIEGQSLFVLVKEDSQRDVPTRVSRIGKEGQPAHPTSGTQRKPVIPIAVACAVVRDVLHGLHAAHEAKNARGEPLHLVHRDVSPQNVIIGVDGSARVFDFGIAKAADNAHDTEKGTIKGKIAYMAPEQIYGEEVDRRTDVYATGVMLWELLAGRRLFRGKSTRQSLGNALYKQVEPPGMYHPAIPPELDDVVMRSLERERDGRYRTALEMATELTKAAPIASRPEVAEWLQARAGSTLEQRERISREIEAQPILSLAPAPQAKKIKVWLGVGAAAMLTTGTVLGMVSAPESTLVLKRSDAIGVTRTMATPPNPLDAHTLTPQPALTATGSPTAQAATQAATGPPAGAAFPTGAATTPAVGLAGRPAKPLIRRPARRMNCNPPYTIDAKGHKKFKRECL